MHVERLSIECVPCYHARSVIAENSNPSRSAVELPNIQPALRETILMVVFSFNRAFQQNATSINGWILKASSAAHVKHEVASQWDGRRRMYIVFQGPQEFVCNDHRLSETGFRG